MIETDTTAAEATREYTNQIVEKWASLVQNRVPHAAELPDPVLYNFVPDFIEKLADALGHVDGKPYATQGSTVAQEHGSQRVRLTHYEIGEIVYELQLLKKAIYEILESKIPLATADRGVIEDSIDRAILDSVSAFELIEAGFRERNIAMLAHDIRSPLSFIIMASDVLTKGTTDPEEAQGFYSRISSSAKKANLMIQSILDTNLIRKKQTFRLKIQQIDILAIVEDCVKHCPSNVLVEGDSMIGYWSPNDLTRAIDSLLENAARHADPDTAIRIVLGQDHGLMKLSVHNQGEPIPVEEQENIFQLFRRAQASKADNVKGLGFGLPLVRRVIEAHGGSIHVDSLPAVGTTFTIELPFDSRPYQNSPTLE